MNFVYPLALSLSWHSDKISLLQLKSLHEFYSTKDLL